MHHTIDTLIQACQSALSTAKLPHDFVHVAGLGTLLQRLDSGNEYLDTLTTFLSGKEIGIADRVAAKAVPMYMRVEDAQTLEGRQEAWYALYLYISALEFVTVSDFHRVHSRLEEVLVGIDDDWRDLRPFASDIQSAYPIDIADATIDFVNATLGELITDEADSESEEGDVLNLYILNRLKGHIPVQYAEDDDVEVPVDQVLDFRAQAASSVSAELRKHFTFEKSTLFSLIEDSVPVAMVVQGDRSATAAVDGVLLSATPEGDGVFWPFQKGVWSFVIDGAEYRIEITK